MGSITFPVLFVLACIVACHALLTTNPTFTGKTIAVFGSTGKTGRECVFQALQAGHRVIAFARTASKLCYPKGSSPNDAEKPLSHPNLHLVLGDVTNQRDVDSVFTNEKPVDGVIVALGGRTKDVGPTLMTDGTRNIVNAMKCRSKSKRIAVVTSIGCGDSEKSAPWHFKALMYTVMSKMYKDKNNQEKLFTTSDGPGHDLEYCMVRPGGLGEGPPTGVINVKEGLSGSIQRADVASFCIQAVTEPNFPHVRKTPCVSSIFGTGWAKEPQKGFDSPTSD